MNTKILAICVVGLLATVGIGVLSAQPLVPVSGTAILSRGNVAVDTIGVDKVGYKIYTGTGKGAELVGVELSFTAYIPANTVIFVSVRNSDGVELAYDAGDYFGPIYKDDDTMFDLWTSAYYGPPDVNWDGYTGDPTAAQWPFLPDVDYLIVTVAGNSHYVHLPGA